MKRLSIWVLFYSTGYSTLFIYILPLPFLSFQFSSSFLIAHNISFFPSHFICTGTSSCLLFHNVPDNYNFPGTQCCGSRVKKAPDPGSGSTTKNLSIFNPKFLSRALGNMIRDVYSGSKIWIFPSKIPDRGFRGKKAPDPDPQRCWYLFVVNFFHFYYSVVYYLLCYLTHPSVFVQFL